MTILDFYEYTIIGNENQSHWSIGNKNQSHWFGSYYEIEEVIIKEDGD